MNLSDRVVHRVSSMSSFRYRRGLRGRGLCRLGRTVCVIRPWFFLTPVSEPGTVLLNREGQTHQSLDPVTRSILFSSRCRFEPEVGEDSGWGPRLTVSDSSDDSRGEKVDMNWHPRLVHTFNGTQGWWIRKWESVCQVDCSTRDNTGPLGSLGPWRTRSVSRLFVHESGRCFGSSPDVPLAC